MSVLRYDDKKDKVKRLTPELYNHIRFNIAFTELCNILNLRNTQEAMQILCLHVEKTDPILKTHADKLLKKAAIAK